MKKIMIAVFAVAMAIGVEAATVTWNLASVTTPGGDGVGANYLALVFDGATSQSDVTTAIKSKDWSGLAALEKSGWKQDTKSNTSGLLMSAGNGSYEAKDTFSFYAVIFDSDTLASADNFFITQTKDGKIADNGGNAVIAFGTMAAQKTAGSSWQSIPEPTSGLLLLIGVAGLALKRKRA